MTDVWSAPERSRAVADFSLMIMYRCSGKSIVVLSVGVKEVDA